MIIEGNSIAECWIEILRAITDGSGKEISPLIASINVTDFNDKNYHGQLEEIINQYSLSVDEPKIETTAGTIFPASLSGGSDSVFNRFEKIWVHVKKCKKNRHGHYFRRLTAYAEYDEERRVNQLEHILNTYNGIEGRSPVHRRSALIATTFDPTLDHISSPLLGFPCLQQICLIPDADNSTLTLNAIYAMQHLSTRAYGNYLGLIRLGRFMADEMGLTLTRLNCISSVMSLGQMSKQQGKQILEMYDNEQ